jgi:hypothetical protein
MGTLLTALVSALLLGALGCAGDGGGIRVGSERSFDGLVRVKNPGFSAAWVREDFDLSGYSKVMLEGAGIEYQPMASVGSVRQQFPLSETAIRRIGEIMERAFRTEMARSTRFQLTEQPGPDVLLLWGGLLNVVSYVPPERTGRDDVFLRRLGEATLVIELRDSESRATLARIMDRRALEPVSGSRADSVNGLGEVRELANSWARLVRRRLDEAPSLREKETRQEAEDAAAR